MIQKWPLALYRKQMKSMAPNAGFLIAAPKKTCGLSVDSWFLQLREGLGGWGSLHLQERLPHCSVLSQLLVTPLPYWHPETIPNPTLKKKNIYIYIFYIIDWIIRFINCWLFKLFSLYLSFPLTFWLSLLLRSLPLDAQQGSGMMQLLLRLGALIPTFSFKNDSYKFPYPLPL